ncbi:MAG: hypothetical protein AAFN10_00905 [Bacteroidota bacterium]
MNKAFFILLSLSLYLGSTQAQSLHLQIGTSNQDDIFAKAGFQTSFGERLTAGIEGQWSQYNYRFIGAKVVPAGNATWIGIPVSFKAYKSEALHLDFYLRSRLRFISFAEDLDPNRSTAIEIDPGLILTLPINERFQIQSGLMLKTIYELSPEPLLEQQLSSILLLGFNYAPTERLAISLQGQAGPTSGAGGDSMKFYSFLQVGLAYSFGERSALSSLMMY